MKKEIENFCEAMREASMLLYDIASFASVVDAGPRDFEVAKACAENALKVGLAYLAGDAAAIERLHREAIAVIDQRQAELDAEEKEAK